MADDKTKADARDRVWVAGHQDHEVAQFAPASRHYSLDQARNLIAKFGTTGKFSNEKRGSLYTEDWHSSFPPSLRPIEAEAVDARLPRMGWHPARHCRPKNIT